MTPISIAYSFRPRQRSLATGHVADLFGLDDTEPPHNVADNVTLDIRPGDLVLFSGPSGSGKSSLMRAAGGQLQALDAGQLELPERALVDCLSGPIEVRLELLSACGLSEARLLLRCPGELSDGQRYRFRLALAFNRVAMGGSLLADEFASHLDRTLAKVLAFNLRRLCSRSGVGCLLATTHVDLLDDLNPDLWVRCLGDAHIECERRDVKKKKDISFAHDLWISEGTRGDWPYFARWHYRSHHLAFTRRIVVLWHGVEPIGICVFSAPAASLKLRSRYFGLHQPRSSERLASLNRHLWLLSRVVLHPTYRGAGMAAAFVRRACQTCPIDWIETLTAMGQINPLFERAGFVRGGIIRKDPGRRQAGSSLYGRRGQVTQATRTKSQFSEPVYYVLDNRARAVQ